ncbi:MAG TPA: thermonuclease family protein [Cryobacterium sp.]|nr:thermonuclease family protein [Cryobacterium sp.]
MSRKRGRSGVLVGIVVLGALGFAWVQQSGSLPTAFESLLSSVSGSGSGSSTESAEPGANAADDPAETAVDDIPAPPSGAVAMTVEYVHDGDTLFLRTDQPNELVATTDDVKVRLLGIDTPEVGDRAECFGDQATEQLRALLPEGSLTWVTADRDPTDQYGRSLFYLWTEDGRFVNYELVAGGAAESLNIAPNDAHYPLLRAAEDAAASAGAGRWGSC